MARILKNGIGIENLLILKTDSDTQSHMMVKVSLMWQQAITIMCLEPKIKFGQDHNIHQILVISTLSLELSMD
jgi:hypothetical protein